MKFKPNKMIFLLLPAVFALSACTPQAAPATLDANEIAGQVMTAVAATVSVGQTQTAEAQPTATFTFTPAPPTETPLLPTATPFVIPTATRSSSGGGGGGTINYPSCDPDIGKRPRDNAAFKPGDSFDVKWTIVNNGNTTWEAGYDLVYYSGPQLTGATYFELPRMKPGDKWSIVMDAAAPMERGHYVMTWKLQGGFCYPYVAITVE